jgi:hypothetical protein
MGTDRARMPWFESSESSAAIGPSHAPRRLQPAEGDGH